MEESCCPNIFSNRTSHCIYIYREFPYSTFTFTLHTYLYDCMLLYTASCVRMWRLSCVSPSIPITFCLVILFLQEQYTTNMRRKEKERRLQILSSLSDSQKINLFMKGLELVHDQDRGIEHLDCIPTLFLSGIYMFTCVTRIPLFQCMNFIRR